MKTKRAILNIALPLISVGVIILAWCIAAKAVDSEYILPTVGETLSAAFSLLKSGSFYQAFFNTFLRSVIAFLCSFILAFIFAFFSYKSINLKKAFAPFIIITRALPTIAVVLLLLVWTTSKIAPIIVTTLVVFPTLYNNIYAALSKIDKELLEMCKVFGVKKSVTLKRVVLPSIASEIILAIGSGLTLNLKLMVAAEVLSQTARSLGFLLNTSKAYFETPTMLALVLFTVVTGLVIELITGFIAKKAGKI